jgi:hypothetical protein
MVDIVFFMFMFWGYVVETLLLSCLCSAHPFYVYMFTFLECIFSDYFFILLLPVIHLICMFYLHATCI